MSDSEIFRMNEIESQKPHAIVHPHISRTSSGYRIDELCPENALEIEALIDLFIRHYGDSYPVPEVYDSEFWSSAGGDVEPESQADPLGSYLTSAIVKHAIDDRILAHLAIRSQERGKIELIFPAVDPDWRSELSSISDLLWNFVVITAGKRLGDLIFFFARSDRSASQLIATQNFQALEMALVPTGKGGFGADDPSTLLLMYKYLNSASQRSELFFPDGHAEFLNRLLKGTDYSASESEGMLVGSSTVDTPSFSRAFWNVRHWCHDVFAVSMLAVMPRQFSNPIQALDYILWQECEQRRKGRRLGVEIALDDPKCPELCRMLENAGFQINGIVPNVAGHDFVLYSRLSREEIQAYTPLTPRGEDLKAYLLTQSR